MRPTAMPMMPPIAAMSAAFGMFGTFAMMQYSQPPIKPPISHRAVAAETRGRRAKIG